ncbi:hypothetical protein FKP32DRAFT_845907 [Trametes sanguinea]|nr:hypothetical protein FKP32DRAFT_845907 [Trametes sanguinea]
MASLTVRVCGEGLSELQRRVQSPSSAILYIYTDSGELTLISSPFQPASPSNSRWEMGPSGWRAAGHFQINVPISGCRGPRRPSWLYQIFTVQRPSGPFIKPQLPQPPACLLKPLICHSRGRLRAPAAAVFHATLSFSAGGCVMRAFYRRLRVHASWCGHRRPLGHSFGGLHSVGSLLRTHSPGRLASSLNAFAL